MPVKAIRKIKIHLPAGSFLCSFLIGLIFAWISFSSSSPKTDRMGEFLICSYKSDSIFLIRVTDCESVQAVPWLSQREQR